MKVQEDPFPEMNLNISLPRLKHFEFDSWDSESSGEVKLHAPSLSSFIFNNYMSTNLTLMNLSSLATADIKIRISSQVTEIWARRVMGLLREIHNVEVLTLDHNFLEVEFDPDNIGDDWDAGLSLPCRICHLKIAEIKGLHGNANELKFLELLLKHAMVLEKVVLTSSTKQDSEREKRMAKFSEMLLTFPTASKKIFILLKF
ncbi:hypothetical protein C5167_031188 [Papaver somniferum]|nr:hypothetical protein C5167_031188 [Papaver somniferum]